MMNVHDIQGILERWAPTEIAWERDNVGLQVGNPMSRVRGILVSLDVTGGVVAEARRRGANLIISHHPLLFRPARSVRTNTGLGSILRDLLKWNVACYAAHTNLDFTRGGTSFVLSEALGLRSVGFLEKSYRLDHKVVTFVPADHVADVVDAMAKEGAGQIGNYTVCSFRSAGTGTFHGNALSTPVVGTRGRLEEVPEIRLEMIAARRDVPRVVRAMKSAHPYEEVAYDVYPLDNVSDNYGRGAIGTLERPVTLRTFLNTIKQTLRLPSLRYRGSPDRMVQKIAVCGGSGSELMETAIAEGADVFVTADVKYHDFHSAGERIVLVDAGHFETENPVVKAVVARIRDELRHHGAAIPVSAARTSTNPVAYL
jgi:dinuclear metal center YbgI/SA1388 family protein